MAAPTDDEVSRPRELVPLCLLLLLAEAPGHGYELMERLKPLGFDWNGPGPIYRELRALEDAGLVTSAWAVRQSGPGRRVYEVTAEGRRALGRSEVAVVRLQTLIAEFLARHRRLPPPRSRSRPPGRRLAS